MAAGHDLYHRRHHRELSFLIGIVKKNAIMMIDFALAPNAKEASLRARQSTEACLLRLRPI